MSVPFPLGRARRHWPAQAKQARILLGDKETARPRDKWPAEFARQIQHRTKSAVRNEPRHPRDYLVVRRPAPIRSICVPLPGTAADTAKRAESALGSGSLNGVSGALPRCGDLE